MTVYDRERDGPLDHGREAIGNVGFTHALVIGIGRYTYMTGGHAGRLVESAFDFGQIVSSPVAAREFALWLLEEFNNPRAPLGSIELLTSPEITFQSLRDSYEASAGTLENVQEAFDKWFERCHSNPANVAVFYFSGHGVMAALEHALLLENFGKWPNPFAHAINFNHMHRVMGSCKAETQLYFIDSCRESSPDAYNYLDNFGQALGKLGAMSMNCHEAPIFQATAPGGEAYGSASCGTRFTAALLACLRGRGARRSAVTHEWVLTTSGLSEALPLVICEFGSPAQTPRTEGSHCGRIIIHVLPGPPEVEVCISCSPEAAYKSGRFIMAPVSAPTHVAYASERGNGPWTVRAEAGHYIATVEFETTEFASSYCEIWVDPPGPSAALIQVPRQDAKGT